jgi:hypothetical protein
MGGLRVHQVPLEVHFHGVGHFFAPEKRFQKTVLLDSAASEKIEMPIEIV